MRSKDIEIGGEYAARRMHNPTGTYRVRVLETSVRGRARKITGFTSGRSHVTIEFVGRDNAWEIGAEYVNVDRVTREPVIRPYGESAQDLPPEFERVLRVPARSIQHEWTEQERLEALWAEQRRESEEREAAQRADDEYLLERLRAFGLKPTEGSGWRSVEFTREDALALAAMLEQG